MAVKNFADEELHPSLEPVAKLHRIVNHLNTELESLAAKSKEYRYPKFVTDILGQSTVLGAEESSGRSKYRHVNYEPQKPRHGLFGLWDELHNISRHMGGNLFTKLEAYQKKIAADPQKAELAARLGTLMEASEMMKDDFLPILTQILDTISSYRRGLGHEEETSAIRLGIPAKPPLNIDLAFIAGEGPGRYERYIKDARRVFIKATQKKYGERHPGAALDEEVLDLAFALNLLRIGGGQGIQAHPQLQHRKIMISNMGLGIGAAKTLERAMNRLAKMGVDMQESRIGLQELPQDADASQARLDHPARHIHHYIHDIQMMTALANVMQPEITDKAVEADFDRMRKTMNRLIDPHLEIGLYALPAIARESAELKNPSPRDIATILYIATDTMENLLTRKPPLGTIKKFLWGSKDTSTMAFSNTLLTLQKEECPKGKQNKMLAALTHIKERAGRIASGNEADIALDLREQLRKDLSMVQPLADKISARGDLHCPDMGETLWQLSAALEPAIPLPRDLKSDWAKTAVSQAGLRRFP